MLTMILTLATSASLGLWGFQADDAKKLEAEAKEKVAAFQKALSKAKKDDDVIAAIEELGKTRHEKILDALKTWVFKGSVDIRTAAIREVGKYEKEKAAADLLLDAAAKSKEPEIAVKCLRGVGDVGVRAVAKELLRFFENKSLDVAAEAVDACGALKSKATIGPLIDLVRRMEQIKDDDGAPVPGPDPGPGPGPGPGPAPRDNQKDKKAKLLPAALSALRSITGEDKKDGQAWTQWWQKNQATWKEAEEKK